MPYWLTVCTSGIHTEPYAPANQDPGTKDEIKERIKSLIRERKKQGFEKTGKHLIYNPTTGRTIQYGLLKTDDRKKRKETVSPDLTIQDKVPANARAFDDDDGEIVFKPRVEKKERGTRKKRVTRNQVEDLLGKRSSQRSLDL